MSNITEKCQYYLKNDQEREKIAYNGRLWFERNASDSARAHYIYKCCIDIIKGRLK